MKKNYLGFVAIFLACLISISSSIFAYTIGPNSVYDVGSQSYFVRIDSSTVYAPASCGGTIAGPHMNIEVKPKIGPNVWGNSRANWHVVWKTEYKSGKPISYCLISYDTVSRACKKLCYDRKSGKGGDLLPLLGVPTSILSEPSIASKFSQFYLMSGSSPISYPVNVPSLGGLLVVAGTMLTVIIAIVILLLSCSAGACTWV